MVSDAIKRKRERRRRSKQSGVAGNEEERGCVAPDPNETERRRDSSFLTPLLLRYRWRQKAWERMDLLGCQ